MCATCGCSDGAGTRLDGVELAEHDHPEAERHQHGPQHGHHHEHPRGTHEHGAHEHDPAPSGHTVLLEQKVLAKNDALATQNRLWLESNRIFAVNLMSSPGSGKTTLLERTIAVTDGMDGDISVIEGDQETRVDADRIRATGCRVVQINTGAGCHLDAAMLAGGLDRLDPQPGSVVLIENVGNLVCPALFDLGERAKVVLMSVTEGEDKPLKYPHMFRGADMVLLNKVDLLPHLDFDTDRFRAQMHKVNPRGAVYQVSATRGDGIAEWMEWLRSAR